MAEAVKQYINSELIAKVKELKLRSGEIFIIYKWFIE
jgi:hypothetical protein